jgi:soluble lytic murein transglycosylase-like protein
MIPKISFSESDLWVDRPWEKTPGLNHSQPVGNGNPNASVDSFFLALLFKMIEKTLAEARLEPRSSAIPPPFPLENVPAQIPAMEQPADSSCERQGESKPKTKGQDFDYPISEAAAKYDLDPTLIRAVIQVESNRNPGAVSSAGAQGLMQLMPKTAAEMGVTNSFDPAQNIEGGARYLRQLLNRYQGNRRLALAAYNWGMGNLEKRPEALPKETQHYILKVEKAYAEILKRA